MFERLSAGFRGARDLLKGVETLDEQSLSEPMRAVRRSLLEADVSLELTKTFVSRVRDSLVGEAAPKTLTHEGKTRRITPSDRFVFACKKELEGLMHADGEPLVLRRKGELSTVMLAGLQGAGKTTTAAKLARYLVQDAGRRPMLVAADVQRPAAIDQLKVLGAQIDVPVFAIPGGLPVDICTRAIGEARALRCDTLIFDTAGRLAVDEPLMDELAEIKAKVKPDNVLYVVDAMAGQDAVRTAKAFHDRLDLDGVVLTKLDGDARGGSALSIRVETGAPIRFVGLGEDLKRLEPFRAEGFADRILGFGDVVSLMRDFEEVVDEDKAEKDAARMLSGNFGLDDFVEQIDMLQKMGPLQDLLEKVPFFAESVPAGFKPDERELKRSKAIVQSMTPRERRDTAAFRREPSRLNRVAKGSGQAPERVAQLIQQFEQMKGLFSSIGSQAGMLSKVPGMRQLAGANRLRDAVRAGGLEHNPMLANLAEELLEAAVAEGPGGGSAASGGGQGGGHTKAAAPSRNKRKAIRKQQKKARKKARR